MVNQPTQGTKFRNPGITGGAQLIGISSFIHESMVDDSFKMAVGTRTLAVHIPLMTTIVFVWMFIYSLWEWIREWLIYANIGRSLVVLSPGLFPFSGLHHGPALP